MTRAAWLGATVVCWAVIAACQSAVAGERSIGHAQEEAQQGQQQAPPLPVRRFDQQEEGASLRRMINQFSAPIEDQGRWQVYYDDVSGFPYFYDSATGVTQWENPWAQQASGTADVNEFLRSSWRLYERFRFTGMFDDLTAMRNRRRLPRARPSIDAMRSIAAMAGMQFDVAQARLEVALLKTEARAGTVKVQDATSSADTDNGNDVAESVESGGGSPAVGDEDDLESLLSMALEEEVPEALPQAREHLDASAQAQAPASIRRALSHPPPGTRPGQRIALAGGWNDLANMWFARGEWELALECFRRSLFWNPEQTAALINLASLLVKLGFERDAAVVWDYFVDVEGGTMGGWAPEREEAVVASIESGLQLARQLPGARGRTLGELRLASALPSADEVRAAAQRATAASDLDAVLSHAAAASKPSLPADQAVTSQKQHHVKRAAGIASHRGAGLPALAKPLARKPGAASAASNTDEPRRQGQEEEDDDNEEQVKRGGMLPPPVLGDLRTHEGALSRIEDVGSIAGMPAERRSGLLEYASTVSQRLSMDPTAAEAVLERRWLWGVLPLSNDPTRPLKDIAGWGVGICLFAAMAVAAWSAFQSLAPQPRKRVKRQRGSPRKPKAA